MVFLPFKLVLSLFVMLQKMSKNTHFRCAHRTHSLAWPCPPILIIPPLRTRAPPLNDHTKACDACVAGGGLGGRATIMQKRGRERHDGDNNDDDNAAVAADGEGDERMRR